jgi:hypothetical protein
MLYRVFWTSLIMLLLIGCSPGTAVSTPVPTPFPDIGQVYIRIQNDSDTDFQEVKLQFTTGRGSFGTVAAGTQSDYQVFPEAFQSASFEVITMEAGLGTDASLLVDGEGELPITSGYYTFILDIHNDTILASLEPDMGPIAELIAPVTDSLTTAGLSINIERSIQRGTLFDELAGKVVSSETILMINDQRVDLIRFAEVETAVSMAAAVQPGGSSFVYTRDDGTAVQKFDDANVGGFAFWWLYGSYLVRYAGKDANIVGKISEAFDSLPLNSEEPEQAGDAVQIRLTNLSDIDFENVTITFVSEEIDYGALPAGATSGYQTVKEAYRYAAIFITSNGQTQNMFPIDYVGETPLATGRYIYALDLIDGVEIQQTALSDDEWLVDLDLIGTKWYWISQGKPDGSVYFPVWQEGERGKRPYLEFFDLISTNQGETGYQFGGYTGCNSLFGTYFVNTENALIIPGIGQTEAGCEAVVAESEQIITGSLHGIGYYERHDTWLYVWSSPGGWMIFSQEAPESLPPYAVDERSALAPLLHKLLPVIGAATAVAANPPFENSSTWEIELFQFQEVVKVHVFTDVDAAGQVTGDDVAGKIWRDGRFLLTYPGDYDPIFTTLDELFPKLQP